MKKMLCVILGALLAIVPTACISRAKAESAFQPRLDTDTSCQITVIGSYSNFEALETEFDRFNEFYPDVEMSYWKPDDYNNLLGTVLESSCWERCWKAVTPRTSSSPINGCAEMKNTNRSMTIWRIFPIPS